jgi:hypothetical protein
MSTPHMSSSLRPSWGHAEELDDHMQDGSRRGP